MDPITWIMIASALVSYFSANEAAEDQAEAVRRNTERQQTDRMRQQGEVQRQAAAAANEEARRRQADLALFDVVAGEFGGGPGVQRQRAVRRVVAEERMATLQSNEGAALGQLGMDGVSLASQADSRLAAIDRPSPFATALQIGAAYYGRRSPKTTTNTTHNYDRAL